MDDSSRTIYSSSTFSQILRLSCHARSRQIHGDLAILNQLMSFCQSSSTASPLEFCVYIFTGLLSSVIWIPFIWRLTFIRDRFQSLDFRWHAVNILSRLPVIVFSLCVYYSVCASDFRIHRMNILENNFNSWQLRCREKYSSINAFCSCKWELLAFFSNETEYP